MFKKYIILFTMHRQCSKCDR